MTQEQNTTAISIMHPVCCGLDVHRMKIAACLITIDSDGNEQSEIREFGAFTDDLLYLRAWALQNGLLSCLCKGMISITGTGT